MQRNKVIILIVALVAALGVVVLLMRMMRPKPAAPVAVAAAPAKPMVRVVVAKQDLPIGRRIGRDDLAWQDWPVEAVNPAFITDGAAPPPVVVKASVGKDEKPALGDQAKGAMASLPIVGAPSGGAAMDSLQGAVVREPIFAKEPITQRKIVRAGEGGYVAALLQPGMRAVALPITTETGAGGLIQPGDRVDVMQSHHLDKATASGPGAGQDVESHVVLRNLRVIAIDQTIENPKSDKAIVGSTATLEVSAADAPALARAKTQGDFSLALRSYADAGGPSGRVANDVVNHQVRFYRAGQRSETTVTQ